jgi:hypothetical protein
MSESAQGVQDAELQPFLDRAEGIAHGEFRGKHHTDIMQTVANAPGLRPEVKAYIVDQAAKLEAQSLKGEQSLKGNRPLKGGSSGPVWTNNAQLTWSETPPDVTQDAVETLNSDYETLNTAARSELASRMAVAASDASEQRIMADADRAAMAAFEIAGVDPEAALHRIRYEGPVDKATAHKWRSEEVEESAKARTTNSADATLAVHRAHEAAFAAYSQAAKRLRTHAPVTISGDTEAARAVQAEQQDMSLKAELVEETARKSRKLKL